MLFPGGILSNKGNEEMTDDPLEPEDDDLSDTLDGAPSTGPEKGKFVDGWYVPGEADSQVINNTSTLIIFGLFVVMVVGIYWISRPKATPDTYYEYDPRYPVPQYVVPGLEERIRRGNEILDSAREELKQWERKKKYDY
jgi:hypothetical protein